MKLRLTDDGTEPLEVDDLQARVKEAVQMDRPVATKGGITARGQLGFFVDAQETRRDSVARRFVQDSIAELVDHVQQVKAANSPPSTS